MNSDPVFTDEARPTSRWLVRLVALVCRVPALVLALSLVLVGLSVWAACTRMEYQTSRNDLISPRKDYQQRWNNYLAEFGDDDDMVVIVQGQDRAAMVAALEEVAERIGQASAHFDRLFYKVDLRSLRSRALLYLEESDIATIQANLGDMDLLLKVGPLAWRGLGLGSLLREAVHRLERTRPDEPLTARDRQFLGQLLSVCQSARASLANPRDYHNPWGSLLAPKSGQGGNDQKTDQLAEPQYFFNGTGDLAFLLVRPLKESGSFTANLRSVEAMRSLLAEVRSSHPEVQLGLTGLPVLETDEMAAAERDTHRAAVLALAGVCALFLLVYRGLAYPILTVVTLLVGTAWAMGFAVVTVGHLNILSATFAVMLIGMGDYGVLWVMRYEQARSQGADVRTALLHTTTHVAIGNLTAAGTLALAFFAAFFADFKAVAELGLIAGCGVLLCALACFTVLPAILMLFDRRGAEAFELAAQPAPEVKPGWGATLGRMFGGLMGDSPLMVRQPTSDPERAAEASWLPGLWPRAGWVVALAVLLVGGLTYAATGIRYDHNLLHLQAHDLDSVRWEKILVEKTSGASWHALSYTNSPEEAIALKARYEQLPEVSQVVEVASLLPRSQETKLPRLRDIEQRLRWLPARGEAIPHLLPDVPTLTRDLARLHRAAQARQDALLPTLAQECRLLGEQIASTPDVSSARRALQEFDERISQDLCDNLHQLREVSHPEPITLADYPPSLKERHIGKSGTWLVRVFARDCLWEFEPLEKFCQAVRTVDPDATGKVFGTVEGLKAMKNGLERAGLYALAVIALILWIDFRSLAGMLLALMPLLVGVVCSVGLIMLLGMPLNPANMIAFPLILGVGVDNGVHVLHDYFIRRRKGTTEPAGGVTISHAIGRGVLVKALTTMIGFGALMISSQQGLIGLGLILTLGVACSMLASLILLPALLILWGNPPAAPEEAAPVPFEPPLSRAA